MEYIPFKYKHIFDLLSVPPKWRPITNFLGYIFSFFSLIRDIQNSKWGYRLTAYYLFTLGHLKVTSKLVTYPYNIHSVICSVSCWHSSASFLSQALPPSSQLWGYWSCDWTRNYPWIWWQGNAASLLALNLSYIIYKMGNHEIKY